MRKWLKALTYVAAAAAGLVGFFVPVAAPVAIPLATGLAGLATRFPGDPSVADLEAVAQAAAETTQKLRR